MFGNPDWFRPKTIGYGLTPVRWQGWAYTFVWIGLITAPFLLLLGREQVAESIVWLTVSMGMLVYDVRSILRHGKLAKAAASGPITAEAVYPPHKDVLYIGDNDPPATHATRNYAFRVKGARG